MKLRVNLFSPALLPPPQVLPLRLLMISLGGLLLLSALVLAILWTLTQQQQRQVTLFSAQQQQQQAQAELMQQALLQRQPDSQLQSQLQNVQQEIQRKQALLQFLQQQQQQVTTFSPVLAHLLTIDRPELWLQHFVLRPDSSSWRGLTQQPQSVALWLQQLAALPQLQGQQFQQVELQQQEGSTLVQFVLQSGGGGR